MFVEPPRSLRARIGMDTPTQRRDDIFREIRVAKPCPKRWSDMEGDDRVRHCSECRLNVFNFSNLTQSEIIALLESGEGRVCGRFYRRPDGTMMTADCRNPLERRAMASRWPVAAMAIFFISAIGAVLARPNPGAPVAENPVVERIREISLFKPVVDAIWPETRHVVGEIPAMPPSKAGP